jgi:hypothetical protein
MQGEVRPGWRILQLNAPPQVIVSACMGSAVPRRVVVATLPILFGVWLASVAEVAPTWRLPLRARVLMLLRWTT